MPTQQVPPSSVWSLLFSGTKDTWDASSPAQSGTDRPDAIVAACSSANAPAPPSVEKKTIAPESQTARLKLEKRPKGKHVTTVSGLDPEGNDLAALSARLKGMCGTGGTVKNGVIELQGDHLVAAERALRELGYNTKRG